MPLLTNKRSLKMQGTARFLTGVSRKLASDVWLSTRSKVPSLYETPRIVPDKHPALSQSSRLI